MIISIIVLAIVLFLIATRRIGNIRLQIWQIMLFGAILVLVTGQISPTNALTSINLDVMLFLFGMFVVGTALEEGGYLSHLSYKLFKRAKSPSQLLLTVLFGMGVASAFLMNDTLAIMAISRTPLSLFFGFLLLPTIINLFLAFLLLSARVIAKIMTVFLSIQIDFRLTYIALIPAVPIIALSPRRFEIVRKIDWRTLIFFAAMFILMQSVWDSGFFQSIITGLNLNITSVVMILPISTLLSQLISNVPLVALYLPMLLKAGASTVEMMALAAGSTIAGARAMTLRARPKP